jgi:hypothetical protein
MPRKPQQPQQRTKWHVYLQARAAKLEWVGEIEAVDEREAIEIAAKEFKQPAKKLIGGCRLALRSTSTYPHPLERHLVRACSRCTVTAAPDQLACRDVVFSGGPLDRIAFFHRLDGARYQRRKIADPRKKLHG